MRRTIVCLANSYKHGGRCVAGVCLEDGKWVRLRAKDGDGSLSLQQCMLADGKGELRLLDVFEAELHFAMASICHPEDWVIAPLPWRLVERPCSQKHWTQIVDTAGKGSTIFRGYRDRMTTEDVKEKPPSASLALICPTDAWWWIREERGVRKHRAIFHRYNVTYDFAVTDPRWLERLNLMPCGIYPTSMFVDLTSDLWLTVSLTDAYHGSHYKLVAAVIV